MIILTTPIFFFRPLANDTTAQTVAFSGLAARASIPVADHGKCATGMTKKLKWKKKSTSQEYNPCRYPIPVRIVQKPCQGVVPRQKWCEQPEEPPGFQYRRGGCAGRSTVQISNAEQQESEIKAEKEGEECKRGAHRGQEKEKREDEPALYDRNQRLELIKTSLKLPPWGKSQTSRRRRSRSGLRWCSTRSEIRRGWRERQRRARIPRKRTGPLLRRCSLPPAP